MAKLACKACGGKVMAKGGVASKAIKKVLPKAKMGLSYGIPQQGTTNYSAATMKLGGALKVVPPNKVKSLGQLPTAVRNKMGYQRKGGSVRK
jgi:hypothetical protein